MEEIVGKAVNFIQESHTYEQVGNYSAAIRTARCALELSKGNAELSGQALLACAQAFFRLGNYSECEHLSQEALQQVGEESRAKVDALRLLGICALECNQMTVGENYLRNSIALSRQIGSNWQLVRSLHSLSAGIYMPRGQFDLSLQADQEALRLCRENGYHDLLWGPLLTQAWVRWLDGQLYACQERLEELQLVARPGSLACGYVYLLNAHLSLDRGDCVKAAPQIEALLSLAENLGSPELRVFGRLARCRAMRIDGQIAQAVSWAEDALKIAVDVGYQHLQALAFIERGRLAWQNDDMERGEAQMQSALAILDPLEFRFDAARAALLRAAGLHQQHSPAAKNAWLEASRRILEGGFVSLLKTESTTAGVLISSYEQPGGILMERFRQLPATPLRIVTFGGLHVWVGEREVQRHNVHRRKAADLLVMLLLAPRRCLLVEQAVEALFPNALASAAQICFHQATSTLRRALEPDLPEKFPSRYLEIQDGLVKLHVPIGSLVDFERLAEFYRLRQWKATLDLAVGEFLPELFYAEWTALQRQRLNDMLQNALLESARELLQNGHYMDALEQCRRLIALEPWQEQAVLLGMRACLAMGERSAARRLYYQLEKALQNDLNSIPSEEIQIFYRSLDQRGKKTS